MKLEYLFVDGIEFKLNGHYYHLYWWNTLPKELRYFGYRQDWYDGPLSSFGYWFGNISWKLPWTNHDGEMSWPK